MPLWNDRRNSKPPVEAGSLGAAVADTIRENAKRGHVIGQPKTPPGPTQSQRAAKAATTLKSDKTPMGKANTPANMAAKLPPRQRREALKKL